MPRYTVDLAEKVIQDLDKFAEEQHISRAEALKRALGLLAIANSERKAGNELGIIRRETQPGNGSDQLKVVGRIAGV